MKIVSIVVPVYNESAGIDSFHNNLLLPELRKIRMHYEVIYVNDGSTDDTLVKLQRLAKNQPDIKVVSLSRNFGKEIATTAGIEHSTGDATIVMDADGQHPPGLLPKFLEKWHAGAQVVVGIRRTNSKEGFVKRVGSKLFYTLFNSSGSAMIPGSTDYRLIDEEVRTAFLRMTEGNRITRGLIDWLGYNREYVEFDAPSRMAGKAGYSFRKLAHLALNSFVSLSPKPLFLVGWLGVIITLLAFTVGIVIFVEQFLLGDPMGLKFTGSALLGIFVSFLVGILLSSQGIAALYLSHIHSHTQNRPLFIVNKKESKNI